MNETDKSNQLNVLNPSAAKPDWKWLLTILFGLFVIWTGVLRGIEAVAYKPNALWFCMVTGLMAIAGGFLYRVQRPKIGAIVALIAAGVVLAFYLYCFIKQPEKDANYRVGLVIVASIAELVVIALPSSDCCQ